MPSCAVKCCKNHGKKVEKQSTPISFHVFPKDKSIKKKWIDALCRKNWYPGPRTTICSVHFEETCFALSKLKKLLLPDSVPTLKLLPEKNVEQVGRPCTEEPCSKSIDTSPSKEFLELRVRYLENLSYQRLLKIKKLQSTQRCLKKKVIRLKILLQAKVKGQKKRKLSHQERNEIKPDMDGTISD